MVRMVLRRAGRASSVYGVLALLVLLGTCSPAVAFDPVLDPVRDFVARTVTRFVTKSFKGTLEVGALRGSLLSAPVVQGITLRDKHGTVVAQIAELRLAYDLTALLRMRLKIQKIEIVQLQATLAPEPDGSLNLLALLGPAEPVAPGVPAEPVAPTESLLALEVDSLRLRDGELTLHFPALPGVRKLEQIQVAVSAQQEAQALRLQVHEWTMQARPTGLQLRTLQGAVQMLGGRVQIEDVRVQTDQTSLTAHGTLPGGGQEASLLLHAQSQDLTEFGRLIQNDTLKGQADLVVKAQGPPEAVEISSQFSSDVGQVALQSHLNIAATPLHYNGTLEVTNLNLGAFKPQGDLQSDINLQLRVEGSGTAAQERRAALQLELRPSRLRDIVLHPSYIDLAVNAQQVQVQRFDIKTSIAQTTVQGMFDLAGAVDMQYTFSADLAAWQSLVGMPALAGRVEMQGQFSGAWPGLAGRGTVESRNLRYQDNRIDSLHLTFEGSQLGNQPQLTSQLRVRQALVGSLPVEQVTLDVTYAAAEKQVQFAAEVIQAARNGGRARGRLIQEETGQQVVLEELQIRLPDRTWHAAAPLQVAFGPQRLTIGQFRLVHDDESIETLRRYAGRGVAGPARARSADRSLLSATAPASPRRHRWTRHVSGPADRDAG